MQAGPNALAVLQPVPSRINFLDRCLHHHPSWIEKQGSLDGTSGVFNGKQFEDEQREPESEGCEGGESRFYDTTSIS